MNVVRLIERKKLGGALTVAEIEDVVAGFTVGDVSRYQMAALLMAIWFRGMDPEEVTALTGAMLRSGEQLDLGALSPTADKHSTGGLGDKVSLLLAPLGAACGLKVPMLSGRGLGHTGGTLDKLEAIPGYRINLDNDEFIGLVGDVGCAIIGQGPGIAPADGRIYALRDVTGTVDCIPLITASIMSKKLAAGPETIVIDLKVGSGAFMTGMDDARALAESLVRIGKAWHRRMAVIFSDMSQPLGIAVGHANETREAFAALRPGARAEAPPDLVRLTEELVAEMVLTAGQAPDRASALDRVRGAWDEGEAFAMMEAWVSAQGGRLDPEAEDFGLDVAPRVLAVAAPRQGWVGEIACREFGDALAEIGGARLRVEDELDLSAGIDFVVKRGDRVEEDQPLAWIRSRDAAAAARAAVHVSGAVTIADQRSDLPEL
ncbi:thymidine phosphorylase, partial [bacterium]|nr:thymidine phosphorylase [bacterium]